MILKSDSVNTRLIEKFQSAVACPDGGVDNGGSTRMTFRAQMYFTDYRVFVSTKAFANESSDGKTKSGVRSAIASTAVPISTVFIPAFLPNSMSESESPAMTLL